MNKTIPPNAPDPEDRVENDATKTPHGREEIRNAIMDAAQLLLTVKNPSEITVREIARVANVKHPLIHRYFGTKDNLIMEVHTRGIETIKDRIPHVEDIEGNIGVFYDAVNRNKWRQLALARAMLDGVDPRLLQNQYPLMTRVTELIAKRNEARDPDKASPYPARFSSAMLAAMAMGWLVYEPFLIASTGLDDTSSEELNEMVVRFLDDIIYKVA